jgi:hypothetical protein
LVVLALAQDALARRLYVAVQFDYGYAVGTCRTSASPKPTKCGSPTWR